MYVVETIEDDQIPVEEVVAPEPVVFKPWKPGDLTSSLHSKIGTPAPIQHAPPKKDDLVRVTSLMTLINDKFTGLQLVSMSIPALITVALILSVTSFFAGRISAGTSKQANAQDNPLPTVQPVVKQPETVGTPDDIIKAARAEFATDLELSKKSDETDAQKTQVSQSILHVLDSLSKGIAAYPDVGALYFERAQVEKMVMQSAATLKTQAEVDYQKALSLSPLTAAFYIGFADYYDVSGRDPQAIENYEKASKLEPKNIDALYPLAKLYAQSGRISDAQTMYGQILTLLPASSSQYTQVEQELQALVVATPIPVPVDIASSSATLATASQSATATSSAKIP